VDEVLRDPGASRLSEPEKALFAYVGKVNDAPASVRAEDVDRLKALGWDDAAVYDAVTVCALFNFFNRWIDGTGVEDSPPGFYDRQLERFGDRGYAPEGRSAPAPR
jgi:alkylhydroperoxidase family enzyme